MVLIKEKELAESWPVTSSASIIEDLILALWLTAATLVKLIFTRRVGDTQWGDFNVSKFVDEEDNTFTLKGPHPPFEDKEEFHDCVFTIKDYNEFRGEKQTIITRMKDLKPKLPEPEQDLRDDESKTFYDEGDKNESFYPRIT